jgi:hypothetical protein
VGEAGNGDAYIVVNPGGSPIDTGVFGDFLGLNNRGEAVGVYSNEVLRDINGKVSHKPGPKSGSVGTAVNNGGIVVGTYDLGSDSAGGFLTEPSGTVYDLTTLYGFHASIEPGAINASGWIAGYATFGGVIHAALLVWK